VNEPKTPLELGYLCMLYSHDCSCDKAEALFKLRFGYWPEHVWETSIGIVAGPVKDDLTTSVDV